MNTLRLGNVCTKIGSGATPRGGKEVYVSSGVTLIRSQNVYNDGFRTQGLAFIDDEHAAQLSNVEVQVGDVLLNITGDSVARACRAPKEILPARVNQHVAIIRPDPDQLDPSYLHYYLVSPEMQASMLSLAAAGATRNALTKAMIEGFEVLAPAIEQQRDIVSVLGALDAKIEHNNQIERVAEGLARAIFRAWFMDFEPVKAKAAGATSFSSIPQEIFNTLPDRLIVHNGGSVPDGWDVRSLTDLVELNPPRSIRKGLPAPYLDMKNMPTDGHSPDEVSLRPFSSGTKFTNGDTLIARITPCLENGKTAFVDFLKDGEVAWGSTEYIVLRPRSPIPPIFAYLLSRTNEFRSFAIQAMTGTSGRQRVPFSALTHFSIAAPPENILLAFGELVEPLIARSSAARSESRLLGRLRDLLLPRLLSGELNVGQGGAR